MPDTMVLLTAGGVLVLMILVQLCAGNKKPVRGALGGMLLGWLCLLAVNVSPNSPHRAPCRAPASF